MAGGPVCPEWGGRAEPETSQEDVCRDLGFPIGGLSHLWGAFQPGEVTGVCAMVVAVAPAREGAAASAGSQTLQLLSLGMCPPRGKWRTEEGGRTGFTNTAC